MGANSSGTPAALATPWQTRSIEDSSKLRTLGYEGLKLTGGGSVLIDSLSVLVKPDVAKEQQAAETEGASPETLPGAEPGTGSDTVPGEAQLPRRFYGTVEIDPDRAGRDMGQVTEEVLQHLTTLPGGKVRVTVEIEASWP